MTHLTFDLLTAYVKKQLAEAAIGPLEAHLAACTLCRQELARVQHFVQQVAGDDLETPRADLTQDILAALRQRLQQRRHLPFHRANLGFDSWATPTSYAMRGVTHERQLLYTVEKGDIDLQIAYDKSANLFTLRGQILTVTASSAAVDSLRGIVVCLFSDALLLRQAVTNELGHFRFSELAPGLYALRIDWHEERVLIEAITLMT